MTDQLTVAGDVPRPVTLSVLFLLMVISPDVFFARQSPISFVKTQVFLVQLLLNIQKMIAGQWYVHLPAIWHWYQLLCMYIYYCFHQIFCYHFCLVFFLQFLFSPFLFADVHVCVCVFVVDTFHLFGINKTDGMLIPSIPACSIVYLILIF